jgi:hypothetical protein
MPFGNPLSDLLSEGQINPVGERLIDVVGEEE